MSAAYQVENTLRAKSSIHLMQREAYREKRKDEVLERLKQKEFHRDYLKIKAELQRIASLKRQRTETLRLSEQQKFILILQHKIHSRYPDIKDNDVFAILTQSYFPLWGAFKKNKLFGNEYLNPKSLKTLKDLKKYNEKPLSEQFSEIRSL